MERTRRTRPWLVATAAAVVAFGVGGCTAPTGGAGESGLGAGEDWVRTLPAQAVVEATLLGVDEVSEEEAPGFDGYPLLTLQVDEVLLIDELNPAFPLPEVARGDTVTGLLIRTSLEEPERTLSPGARGVWFLNYGYSQGPDGRPVPDRHWSVTFGLAQRGDPLPPWDTDSTRLALKALLGPDEASSDVPAAVIEYVVELNTMLRAAARGASSGAWAAGPRSARLQAAYGEDAGGPAERRGDAFETWRSLPWLERHLPGGYEDVPPEWASVMDVELVGWEVLVVHGDALAGRGAITLAFEDLGLMGTHVVDHARGATFVTGLGPPVGAPSLRSWPEDADLLGLEDGAPGRVPPPDVIEVDEPAFLAAFLTSDVGSSGTPGVFAVVDLTGAEPIVEVLDLDAYEARLEELRPLLDVEPHDPDDPEPSG